MSAPLHSPKNSPVVRRTMTALLAATLATGVSGTLSAASAASSAPSGAVVATEPTAPVVSLTGATSTKVGVPTTVTWTLGGATADEVSLETRATTDFGRTRDNRMVMGLGKGSGTIQVPVSEPGIYNYRITAQGYSGYATATLQVVVYLPSATPTISVPPATAVRGGLVPVTVAGLYAVEPFTVSVAGKVAGRGWTDKNGRGVANVRLPAGAVGDVELGVVASQDDRSARTTLNILSAAQFKVTAPAAAVRPNAVTSVTVTGMAPGEAVEARYKGVKVTPSTAKADARGTYVAKFNVGRALGKHQLYVRGAHSTRNGRAMVTVKGTPVPNKPAGNGARGR